MVKLVFKNPYVLLTKVVLAILYCQTMHVYAQKSSALKVLINEKVEAFKEDRQTFGFAIGLIDDGYLYKYGFGQVSGTNPIPPDSSTYFHLGAISKVYTATVFQHLVAESLIAFSDPISNFLPDSLLVQNPELEKISIGSLSTHTSGLPKEAPNLASVNFDNDNPYKNYTTQYLYEFLASYQPRTMASSSKKRKRELKRKKRKGKGKGKGINNFRYSHLGFGLLGHLIEQATSKPLDQLINEVLCQNYQNCGIKIELDKNEFMNLAPGHHFNGKKAVFRSYGCLSASEGLKANLNDVLAFVNANLNAEPKSILAECHKANSPTEMPNVAIGSSWFIIGKATKDKNKKAKKKGTFKRPLIYTHSGRTAGYSNYIAFEKSKKIGVVILSNSATRVDELGIEIMELLLR